MHIYQRNTAVLSLYKRSRFVSVLHWFCLGQCLKGIWPLYSRSVLQRLKVSTNIKALLAVILNWINRKDVFAIICQPDIESKFIIIRLIPVGNAVLDRLFIPSPCHNFGCVYSEVSGGLSYSQTAKPCHFNEDVHEHHLLKEAYAFVFGSPEAFSQNEKWRCWHRNMFSKQFTFAIVADENILANTHIDPGKVWRVIPIKIQFSSRFCIPPSFFKFNIPLIQPRHSFCNFDIRFI